MNTRQWTVLFVAMLSFEYATATFFFGNYGGVHKTYAKKDEGYYGWSQGCRCDEDLTYSLDRALKGVKDHLSRYDDGLPLKDRELEEYEFRDGACRDIHKFERRGPYRCSLSPKYVRIFFSVRFYKLVIHYYVSLVEDILTGFLGGIGSLIGKIFGKVTNFFFRVVLPDVYVTVVLYQRLGSNHGFEVEGLHLNNIDKIELMDKKLKNHESSFTNYFRPVCDHALRNVFSDKVGGVFTKHFSKVSAKKDYFYYEKSSHGEYDSDGEYDGDGEYDSEGKYDSDGEYDSEGKYDSDGKYDGDGEYNSDRKYGYDDESYEEDDGEYS